MNNIKLTLIPCLIITLITCSCKNEAKKKGYLKEILSNLNQIESASYNDIIESYAPGDTAPAFTQLRYYKEFRNPSDSAIGSSYVSFLQKDTTRMTFCYDGNMRAVVYEEEGLMVIDSFKLRILPFRPISPPFFNHAYNILKYIFETNDSLSLDFNEYKDSLLLTITIYAGKQVEFFGKAFYMDDPYGTGDEISKYSVWINKRTNLPYKIRREMSHDISVSTISNINLNRENLKNFKAESYFPADLKSVAYGSIQKIPNNDLEGKKAPLWNLKDANNNSISLKDLKSRVLLIQFTSVSCGPCRASVPFLKNLVSEFTDNDFDLVSIESWTRNTKVLKSYQIRNNFDYKFLMSTDEVNKDYNIISVPVFFILDKNHVIKKIITGYGEGTTDQEIREIINRLI
jgi:thiol-disulfide isomerase/thioredoxin